MEKKETNAAIISLRVSPRFKQYAQEEARRRGETLSDFLWDCIDKGWDIVIKEDARQSGNV